MVFKFSGTKELLRQYINMLLSVITDDAEIAAGQCANGDVQLSDQSVNTFGPFDHFTAPERPVMM